MTDVYESKGQDIHSGKPRHRVIADLVEGPRVLDFGCGTGDLLMILQDEHPDWWLAGIDISPAACWFMLERGFSGRIVRADHVSDRGQYDTIVASQVLEHIEDDEAVVENLAQALCAGGLLIASVPNDGAVESPDHKRTYTKESFTELLRRVGEPELHSWTGEATRIVATVRKSATAKAGWARHGG